MTTRRWLRALAAVALAAGVARAEPSPAEISVARRLFSEATTLRAEERYAEAAAKLREAIAIKDTPGLRFHLAHCEDAQGRLVEALVEYERASELVASGAAAPDVEPLLGPAREALRERVPTVAVRVRLGATTANDAETLAGVALAIDEQPVAAELLGTPIPLNPGAHRVRVTAPGRRPFSIELAFAEGEDRAMEADLAPDVGPAPPAPPPRAAARPEPAPAEDRGPGFGGREIALVSSGVLLAGGVGLGVWGLVRRGDAAAGVEKHQRAVGSDPGACVDPAASLAGACRDLQTAVDDRAGGTALAVAGFVTAGVAAGAGAAVLLFWPAEKRASVGLAPVPGGAALALRGRL